MSQLKFDSSIRVSIINLGLAETTDQHQNAEALVFCLSLHGPSAQHSLSQHHQQHLVDQLGTAKDIHRVIKVTVQIGHRHQSSQAGSAEACQQSPATTRRHFGETSKFQGVWSR